MSQRLNRNHPRRWLAPLALVMAGVLAWLAWSYLSRPVVVFDYEQDGSVSELADASDAVVVGTIGPEVVQWEDRGGNPAVIEGKTIEGHPMVLIEVQIQDLLGGNVDGSELVVARPDLSRLRVANMEPIDEGAQAIFFLEYVTRGAAPDLPEGYDGVWVVVGGEGGVFDLDEQVATPRSGPISLESGGQSTETLTVMDVAEVVGS